MTHKATKRIRSGGSFTILNASNAWNRWGLSGGALWVDKTFTQSGGTLVISESKAEARGGAIFAGSFSQSGGSIEIRNSTAKTLGGAIWINFNFHQSDGRLIISHSGAEKGAIYVQYNFIQSGGSLSISNSQARVTGGALYVGHNFTKSGGHFTTTNATARDSGGAVHVHEFFVQSGGDLVVSNARCTQKIAGGAISVFESFTFSGGSIEIMDVFAGALYIGRDFVQTDGSFSIDQSSSEYSGGAMFVSKNLHQSGGTLSISNSTSGRRGGSIYCGWNLVQSGGSINIKHSAARQSGGALNVAKNLSLHGSLKVRDATSEVDGGGVSVMGDLEMMNTSAIFRGCHAKTGADVSGAALFAANLTQIGGAMLVKESGGRGDILHIPGQWSLDSGSVQLQRCSSTTFAMHVGSCELRGFLEASNCSAPYGLLASAGPALVRNASFETSAVPQLRTSRAFVSDWQVTGSQAWIASGDVTQVHNLDCDADYGARSDETGAGCGNCTQGFTFLKNRSMATIWELQQMQGCALCPMGAVSCNSSRLEMPPGLTLEKGNISRSLHCPNPLACPGGLVSDASQQFCEEGYEGLGCSQCADHCGRSDSNVFVCLTCASGFLRAARDTVLFLAGDAIVFTMSAARVIGATSTNRNSAVYLNQLMAFAAATSPALLAVQQTATFRDQLNVLRRWIGIASVPVQIGDLGQSSTFVSAECLVTYLGLEPSLFSSHVLSAVVYVLLALILALRAGAGVALVVAVNCFLPKFCAAFGRYLICYRMEPADIQPEQQCLLDNKFLVLGRMLALVAIALCFIVGPGSWLKITQEKSLAEEPQVLYLTRSYHTGYETWEVERLVRKMCLKLVSTTFPVTLNPSTQMAGVNFILIASLSLHATNRPYMKAEWNRMELVLLVTASVIIVLTTLCLANEIHWAHSARVQISLILTILVLLTSSGALLFALSNLSEAKLRTSPDCGGWDYRCCERNSLDSMHCDEWKLRCMEAKTTKDAHAISGPKDCPSEMGARLVEGKESLLFIPDAAHFNGQSELFAAAVQASQFAARHAVEEAKDATTSELLQKTGPGGQQSFSQMDLDKNGMVEPSEFRKAFSKSIALGGTSSSLFEKVDLNKDSEVNLIEFQQAWEGRKKSEEEIVTLAAGAARDLARKGGLPYVQQELCAAAAAAAAGFHEGRLQGKDLNSQTIAAAAAVAADLPKSQQMALRCLAAGFSAGLATAGAKSCVEAARHAAWKSMVQSDWNETQRQEVAAQVAGVAAGLHAQAKGLEPYDIRQAIERAVFESPAGTARKRQLIEPIVTAMATEWKVENAKQITDPLAANLVWAGQAFHQAFQASKQQDRPSNAAQRAADFLNQGKDNKLWFLWHLAPAVAGWFFQEKIPKMIPLVSSKQLQSSYAMAPKKLIKKRKRKAQAEPPVLEEATAPADVAPAVEKPLSSEPASQETGAAAKRKRGAAEEAEKVDRKGVIHLVSVPLVMGFQKLRHLMEQFGEVGRVYLAPEEKIRHQNRKRAGGNRKLRFTEGWVEFLDRRIARRVAETLHGTTIGGKKRHNAYRDDMWNMRYLPGFKWHMLKEGTIYDQQVRKARLQQRMSQAQRENSFYLESVEKAKTQRKIIERRAAKGRGDAGAAAASEATPPRRMAGGAVGASRSAPGAISDKVLNQLL
eukprot:s387_g20.t1